MIINKISIAHFQSFGQEQTVEISSGVYSIIGKNQDSGGSNGAGKTAFVRAINLAILGSHYSDVSIKNIKNSLFPEAIPTIEIEGTIRGKSVKIRRALGHDLHVEYDGAVIEGKQSDIQKKLLEIIGLSADQFNFLTYKNQFSAANFLYMKDAARKDFLIDFLCTSEIEKGFSYAQKQVKEETAKLSEILKDIDALQIKKELIEKNLATTEEQIANGHAVDIDETTKKIAKATEEIEELKKTINNIQEVPKFLELKKMCENNLKYISQEKEKVILEKDEIERQIAEKGSDSISQIESVNQKILKTQKELESTELELQKLQKLCKALDEQNAKLNTEHLINLQKLQELGAHLENHQNSKCHYCQQDLPEHLKAEIKLNLQAQYNIIQEQCADIEEIMACKWAEKDKVQNEVDKLLNTKNSLSMELMQLQVEQKGLQNGTAYLEVQVLKQKLNNLKMLEEKFTKDYENEVNGFIQEGQKLKKSYEDELSKKETELKTLMVVYNFVIEERKRLQTQLSELKQSVEKIESEIELKKKAAGEHEKVIHLWSHVSSVFHKNGLVSFLFDDILTSMTQKINKFLEEIPIVSRFCVDVCPYVNDGLTAKDRAINIKIYNENGQQVPIEVLSGAERQTIALLVDIALDDILEERFGGCVGYKIYDEQFSWVDNHNKEYILDFLKKHYANKLLLLIDHSSELNSAIENVIIIQKSHGQSTVCVQKG